MPQIKTARRTDSEYSVSLTKRRKWYADPAVAGLPVDDLAPLTGDSPPPVITPPKPNVPTTPAQTIDWSKIDPKTIPDTVVKQTTAFGDVLTESVQRRQEIKALKEQIKPVETPAEIKLDADTPEWAKALVAQNKALADKLSQVETLASKGGRDALIQAAIKANNLPTGSENWITGKTNEEITAQAAELSKTFLTPQAGGSAGNGGTETQVDKVRAEIARRINRSGPIDPVEGSFFNPAVQNAAP